MISRVDIVRAIHERRVVTLTYERDLSPRVVHPHVLYKTSKGKECVDAYQISGPTHSGPLPAWRPFDVRKIVTFRLEGRHFTAAPGYNHRSRKYRHGIIARVD